MRSPANQLTYLRQMWPIISKKLGSNSRMLWMPKSAILHGAKKQPPTPVLSSLSSESQHTIKTIGKISKGRISWSGLIAWPLQCLAWHLLALRLQAHPLGACHPRVLHLALDDHLSLSANLDQCGCENRQQPTTKLILATGRYRTRIEAMATRPAKERESCILPRYSIL